MSITPLSGSESTESGEVWGDYSGGQLLLAFQHPAYTSSHIVRVAPFDATGTYSDSSGSKETTLQQTADNIVSLIRGLYAADTSIAAVGVNQTLSDHTGVMPFPYTFTTANFGAGTGGGASIPTPEVLNLNSRGSDGSKWRLTLPGISDSFAGGRVGKTLWPTYGAGAIKALLTYLTGSTNGPISALKTQIVTHNGVPVQFSPGSNTEMDNKRLRRHFKYV